MQGGEQVELDHLLMKVRTSIRSPSERAAPCIVHKDIETTQVGLDCSHHAFDGIGHSKVSCEELSTPEISFRLPPGDGDHLIPGLKQSIGDPPANPSGSTGDEGGLGHVPYTGSGSGPSVSKPSTICLISSASQRLLFVRSAVRW